MSRHYTFPFYFETEEEEEKFTNIQVTSAPDPTTKRQTEKRCVFTEDRRDVGNNTQSRPAHSINVFLSFPNSSLSFFSIHFNARRESARRLHFSSSRSSSSKIFLAIVLQLHVTGTKDDSIATIASPQPFTALAVNFKRVPLLHFHPGKKKEEEEWNRVP